jgi:hypothetical protein
MRHGETPDKLRFEQSCGLKSARRTRTSEVALHAKRGAVVAFCMPAQLFEIEQWCGFFGLRNFGSGTVSSDELEAWDLRLIDKDFSWNR